VWTAWTLRRRISGRPLQCAVRQAASRREHLLKQGEDALEGGWRQPSEPAHKSLAVDGPELIENDEALLALKSAGRSKGERVSG
jgi:hypothetical protein